MSRDGSAELFRAACRAVAVAAQQEVENRAEFGDLVISNCLAEGGTVAADQDPISLAALRLWAASAMSRRSRQAWRSVCLSMGRIARRSFAT
ncbi:MAG: hypothetical protein BMS9Abin01_0623 [Gammaproteobacteria bacterium]|nr:MAG: hypothetical protein BMS9Abin01_0623 [Gammaproteobacteria bacterium]